MSRLRKWERLALMGDFSAMPVRFRWEESGRFAHFIDPNRIAGGFDALCDKAFAMSEHARRMGHWQGSAFDLWLCLFFQHRAQRHASSDYTGSPMLEQLCEDLRIALGELSREEAMTIASKIGPNH